ncbi:MAG TPA: hypothetical protein VKV19_01085 [Ktedonobacteraceae bacterium]|nr:hypothetical protein [Ktedonobacteraceae bacterium]
MMCIISRPAPADYQPEDDIDKLFHRLSQLEPPGELTTRILARIKQLPASPAPMAQADEPVEDLDSLTTRNERQDPS